MDERQGWVLLLLSVIALTSYADNLSFQAQKRVTSILHQAESKRSLDMNAQVHYFVNQLANYPYLYSKGANRPVYRFDGFDCQTFVQMVMGLLHAKSLKEFDSDYIKIAYGALKRDEVSFFNRNHFVEIDLNPINRRNGWLRDVTSENELSHYAKSISATIDRKNWFAQQGKKMQASKQNVTLTYIPKELLIQRTQENRFQPNFALLNKIPTPSVIEIINDPQIWIYHGQPIKKAIGTELIISHMGLLYRQHFLQGEVIYHQIMCGLNWQYKKQCTVTPITCQKNTCDELMMAHATNEYPHQFYYYKQWDGYACSSIKPKQGLYTRCNRVEKLPLYAYLANYHYGSYWNMSNKALLGIHIEKLL